MPPHRPDSAGLPNDRMRVVKNAAERDGDRPASGTRPVSSNYAGNTPVDR